MNLHLIYALKTLKMITTNTRKSILSLIFNKSNEIEWEMKIDLEFDLKIRSVNENTSRPLTDSLLQAPKHMLIIFVWLKSRFGLNWGRLLSTASKDIVKNRAKL